MGLRQISQMTLPGIGKCLRHAGAVTEHWFACEGPAADAQCESCFGDLVMLRSMLAVAVLLLVNPRALAVESLADKALSLVSPDFASRHAAVRFFVDRGNEDAVPALIAASRFADDDRELQSGLEALAGAKEADWFHWMLWQQAHPEVMPFAGYDEFQASLYRKIDPHFDTFLGAGVPHSIRLEEITWGGVLKDGIPALTNPRLIASIRASYLRPDDLVFGVSINGDARAYPLRVMDWHEMFNDVIGGVPVSLAYCTLCSSGILFETTVPGREKPFVFGSSGFLYRSNKLMYDTETNSLWNQFTGRPVVGKLTGSGIVLKTRPVVITKWADWMAANPATRVLDSNTGFERDYSPGSAYGAYFSSGELMFPALVDESKLKAKDYVFALRSSGADKAWPLKRFAGGAVINDKAGVLDLVLIGDQKNREVRAYRSDGRTFTKSSGPESAIAPDGKTWRVTEDALIGPAGESFARLPGHIAYWFAWSGYFGASGELAE